jgi:hypothetical protein
MPQNRFIGSPSRPHFEQILGMIIDLGVILMAMLFPLLP